MASQFCFQTIKVFQQIGLQSLRISETWAPFNGSSTNSFAFNIQGNPILVNSSGQQSCEAYLLLQLYNVTDTSYHVSINGKVLDGTSITPGPPNVWSTGLTVFSSPILIQGTNTFQIVTRGTPASNIVIGNVVVAWQQN